MSAPDAPDPAVPSSRMTESAGGAAPPLVLVADDDELTRELVCEVLAGAGYRTVTAADGERVVELAQRHRPVLIVLDLMMPKMDGYTTIVRLRGDAQTAGIPVIILTGQTDPVFGALSRDIGAIAHVTKPFAPDGFIEAVRQALAGGEG